MTREQIQMLDQIQLEILKLKKKIEDHRNCEYRKIFRSGVNDISLESALIVMKKKLEIDRINREYERSKIELFHTAGLLFIETQIKKQ